MFGFVFDFTACASNLQSGECLHPRNHPYECLVGKPAVCTAAAYITVRSGKPRLLDVALWLLSLWYGPERRHERPPVLIHCHSMEPDFHVLAETGVVELEHGKGKISGQRSESESRWDTVGADRIPYGHALDRARVVKGSA